MTTPQKLSLDNLVLPTLVLLAQAARQDTPALPNRALRAALKDNPGPVIPDDVLDALVSEAGPLRCREGNLATRGIPFPLALPTVHPLYGPGLRITAAGRRHLAARVIDLYASAAPDRAAPLAPSAPAGRRIGERDVLPMVLLAAAQIQREQNGLPASMTQVRERAKRMLPLSPDDLAPLKGRGDARVDQIIRNLISNSHFGENDREFFEHTPEGLSLTEDGAEELLVLTLSALPSPEFETLLNRPTARRPEEQSTSAPAPLIRKTKH